MKEGTRYKKEITVRLAAVEAPISEEDHVVTLLGSLPRSYSTLVTTLKARVDNVRLTFVQQPLIHEEQKLKGQFGCLSGTTSGSQMVLAFIATQKRVKPRKLDCGKEGIFAITLSNERNKNIQD